MTLPCFVVSVVKLILFYNPDAKDTEIFELTQKIQTSEENIQDYEGTITQFRDLVQQMQRLVQIRFPSRFSFSSYAMWYSELDILRTETRTAQDESASAASQTAAMLSLNLKLQSSASKNQARNIDLEIKRIEAREARELLSIIQV